MNMGKYEKMITSEELAKILGISKRTVQALAQQGVITCQKTGSKNRYDLHVVVKEYLEYLAKKTVSVSAPNEGRKLEEEVRLKRAKADMAELELEEIKSGLLSAEDVKDATTDLIMCIRSAVLTLPGILAPKLAETDSATEASEIIKKAVYGVLDGLANYEYDPEEYKRRVREKQGWKDSGEDNGDD